MNANKVISVFGSHAPQAGTAQYIRARTLGGLLARAGYAVATGGYSGTMAAVSQGASEAGGHVIGVTSTRVENHRGARLNRWVETEIRYESLKERAAHLVEKNDGMVVLPGGIGTLSEFALAWNLMQVNETPIRPLVLIGDLWEQTLRSFYRSDFIDKSHLHLITPVATPEAAVDHLVRALAEKEVGSS